MGCNFCFNVAPLAMVGSSESGSVEKTPSAPSGISGASSAYTSVKSASVVGNKYFQKMKTLLGGFHCCISKQRDGIYKLGYTKVDGRNKTYAENLKIADWKTEYYRLKQGAKKAGSTMPGLQPCANNGQELLRRYIATRQQNIHDTYPASFTSEE